MTRSERAIAEPSHEVPVRDWWEGIYDEVFIALSPFYRVRCMEPNDVFPTVCIDGQSFYSPGYQNAKPPDFGAIAKSNAELVGWHDVHEAVAPEVSWLEFAKMIWISSCLGKREDVDPNLQERMHSYSASQALSLPDDDVMPEVMEPLIGKFLKAQGLKHVTIYDEFRQTPIDVNIDVFDRNAPPIRMPATADKQDVSCIHAPENGIVFVWNFDGAEVFIGMTDKALKRAKPEDSFEGLYADEKTYIDWLNPEAFLTRK